jgi:hypothetical protein
MLAGKVPYRDTFPVHGFLSDGGLDWLLFSVLGPNFLLSVTVHHLIGVLFQPALFLVTAAAVRSVPLAALAIPLNLGLSTGIVADRPVLPLLALGAFLWAAGEAASRPRALIAGVLGALGFLYALEFGTFVIAAELIALLLWSVVVRGRSIPFRTPWFVLGLAAPMIPFLVYLGAHGAFVSFVRTSFVDLPSQIERVWGWPFPAPWEFVRAWKDGREVVIGGLSIGPGVLKRMYLAPLFGLVGLGVAVSLRGHRLLDAVRLATVSMACLFFFRYAAARLHLEVGNALTGVVFWTCAVGLYRSLRSESSARLALFRWLAAGAIVTVVVVMNVPARSWAVVRSALAYPQRIQRTNGLVPLTIPRGGAFSCPPRRPGTSTI